MSTVPPACPRKPWQETRHGVRREDPYHWLKDPNWQGVMRDPSLLDNEIRTYVKAENAYSESVMASEKVLRDRLFREMTGRIKEDDSSFPTPDGSFAYYRRFVEGGQHPVFCRCSRQDWDVYPETPASEQILLDGNAEASDKPFFKVADCKHSPDHRYLAYAADESGSEYHVIRIRDLVTGTRLPDLIERAQGELVWYADGESFLYSVLDENHRPYKVLQHRLGANPDTDRVVYEEHDPGFFVGLGRTESRRFLTISAHDHVTSEVRLIPASRSDAEPFIVEARNPGVEYHVTDWAEKLLVLTNADDAVDFKIAEAPLECPSRSNWQDLIAHRPGRYVMDMRLFGTHLIRLERAEALPRIVVRCLRDAAEHELAFEEEAYSLSLAPLLEFETGELRFSYSSMTTPEQLFAYDMETRDKTLLKEQQIPSGHEPSDYITRRIEAGAPDGAAVPVSILYSKDTALDGSAPCLLYGYGAYGMSMPAAFSGNRLSLVDRGFIYAIAHVRGGSEKGYSWYLEGKLSKKENTFTDFIAAAEALASEGFTRAGQIATHGGSAGGMLMGVVANRRPDLFRAILAEVPFVDVLNTMCDKDLPLTPPEWPEWGNPIADEEAYRRLAAFSPYDNVEAMAYPAILATAGLSDPRVTYWEPAKWIAKLRALKTNDEPLLLRTNMEAGHGGASGRFDRLEEIALLYAFALKAFGREA